MIAPGDRLDVLLDAACARFADRDALIGNDRAVTYAALAEGAARVLTQLLDAGHREGEPVIVAVDNQCADMVAQLAVWRAHGVVVPVHRDAPPSVAENAAQRTGARWILSGPGLLPAPWADLVPGLAADGGWVHPLREPGAYRPAELGPDQALVVFTSGSTGSPKGVVLSHRAFAAKLAAIEQLLPFAPGSRTAQVLHWNFSFGQWTSLLTLLNGGTLRLVERFGTQSVLGLLSATRIDRIAVVPSMLRILVRALEDPARGEARRALLVRRDSPRLWIAGGEPLTAGLGRRLRTLLPHAGIADVFGLSETSTSDFILEPCDYDRAAGTIGRPSPGVRFRISAPDGTALREGESGELWLDTPYLMTGYLDDPLQTGETMSGPWFRTGDLARVRPHDGLVELVGRAKQLIVRGGHKVSPLEIEARFAEHPDCAACLAVGVPDPVLGERIHLLVVPRDGIVPDPALLADWGRGAMERYKVPERFHLVDEIPVGRTGKADRLQARRIAIETAGVAA